jgi:hypothetical protein
VGSGTYNPLTITNNTTSSDAFMVRLIDNVYDKGTTGRALTTPRVVRTWFVDKIGGPANTGTGINMNFEWYSNEVDGSIGTYRLYHFNGNKWEKQTAGNYRNYGRDRFLSYRGYTGTFSPFGLGDEVTLLPVNWLSVGCNRLNDKQALVQWSTASETQSDSFVVERSINGQTYSRVGAVKAAGNSSEPRHYSLTDNKAPGARAFYRIKQTDVDGESSNSEVCSVLASDAVGNEIEVYPNPAADMLTVKNNAEEDEVLNLRLTDIAGKEVLRVRSEQKITAIATQKLKPGVYLLSVEGLEGMRLVKKVMICR